VVVDRAEGRLDPEHFLAAGQERRADDIQHLARAGGEQDVLLFDAVMSGDLLHDAAVRIAVAVRILEGGLHRLQHRLGGTVVVLVGGQFDEGVVGLGRRRRLQRGPRGVLAERADVGADPDIAEGCGDSTNETATGYGHGASG